MRTIRLGVRGRRNERDEFFRPSAVQYIFTPRIGRSRLSVSPLMKTHLPSPDTLSHRQHPDPAYRHLWSIQSVARTRTQVPFQMLIPPRASGGGRIDGIDRRNPSGAKRSGCAGRLSLSPSRGGGRASGRCRHSGSEHRATCRGRWAN